MGIKDWFLSFFKPDGTLNISDPFCGELTAEIFYKELAIQACVNLIANTVARSEFLTLEKGKEVRKENYYLLNVEPNQNYNSSKFWREVISKLVYNNECLVMQQDGMFYIVESFDKKEFAFKENIYTGLEIANYSYTGSLMEHEVFYFELHNERIKTLIDGLYNSYGKILKASQDNFKKNNARRGVLNIPASYPQTEKAQKDLEDLLGRRFKRFFDAEGGAVLPLSNNLTYEELASNIGVKSGSDGRDVRHFIDDVLDFVAIAFQIPPQLIKGDMADTEKALNNFLTFCVNPIAELITDEVNRKLYTKSEFLERTYCKLDTTRVKVAELRDIANALDVLTRIGAYTINDSLRALGMEPIKDDWAGVRWMTKNYEPVEKALEGGD